MRRRCTGVVAGLLMAIAGSPAAAAEIKAAAPVAGPVLAGDRVVWADERRDGGFDVRSAPIAGGASSRLLTIKGSPTARYEPRLAGSPAVVVVESIEHQRGGRLSQSYAARFTFAGTPDGKLAAVGGRCSILSEPPLRPRSVDAFGTAFAYSNCERRVTEVRELHSALPPEDIASSYRGLRLAGRWVAWLDGEGGGVSVYDREAKGLAYQLDSPTTGSVGGLDLADDGTVAVASMSRLAVASPASPSLRAIPSAAGRTYHPVIVADTIAFSRSRDRVWPGPGGEVGTVRLDGPERLLATGTAFARERPTADFDGARVAYLTYHCSDATIHVVDADSPLRSFGQRRGCPFALARAPRVKSSLRAVLLDLDCFGFSPTTCGATRIELTRGGVRMGSAKEGTSVPLTAPARAALRRVGRLRVRATGIFQDADGRRERRTSSITLKRP